LAFQEVYGVLLHYLHALGREDISLQEGSVHYTDIETIYLPDRIFLHSDEGLNFSLYKIMVTHKFAQISWDLFPRHEQVERAHTPAQGKYHQAIPPNLPSDLAYFLHLFPNPTLAGDLYLLAGHLEDREVVSQTTCLACIEISVA